MQIRNFLLLPVLFGGLLLTGCCTAQLVETTTKTHPVTLHVSGPPDDKSLDPTSPADPACKRSNAPGCVEAPVNDELEIDFRLTPSNGWRFVEFILCVGGTKAGQVCNLNKYQQVEFGARVNEGDPILNPSEFGVIDLTLLSPDINQDFTEFVLIDHNWVAQDYFYSIRVCRTGATFTPTPTPIPTPLPTDPNCAWTDPPIENGGKGKN